MGIFWSPVYVWISKKIHKSKLNMSGTSNCVLEEEVKHQNAHRMISTERIFLTFCAPHEVRKFSRVNDTWRMLQEGIKKKNYIMGKYSNIFHWIKHEYRTTEKQEQYLINTGFIWNTEDSYKYYTVISHIGRTSYEHNTCIIFNIRFKKYSLQVYYMLGPILSTVC